MRLVQFEHVSKRYGKFQALCDLSLTLKGGEAHALMGENGAGKSTFIKLIAGVERADSMRVQIDQSPITIESAQHARRAGFRFIHQELNCVPQISVAENILLGERLPTRLGVAIDWRAVYQRAQMALAQLGVHHIDVTRNAGQLCAGDQMLAKIAGALATGNDAEVCVYVLDEPTAALTTAESEKLFTVLENLKRSGAAILYVSHRLNEVLQVCEHISVLRDGHNVFNARTSDTDKFALISAMTGRDANDAYPPRLRAVSDDIVCSATNVHTRKLKKLNVTLRAGEVLGVAGLADAGQSDVLRLFMGLETIVSGSLVLGKEKSPDSPADAWSRGVAYIPGERRTQALMPGRSICDNTVVSMLNRFGYLANRAMELQHSHSMAKAVNLKFENLRHSVSKLSGGNQQKVVFARALATEPALLLMDEPTRGVDVGAKFDIYSLVRTLSSRGCAVLLSSSDLPELLGMCDRILVLQEGRQSDIIDVENLEQATLLDKFYNTTAVAEAV